MSELLPLPHAWADALADRIDGAQMRALAQFLAAEKAAGKRIFPPDADIYRALALTPPAAVKAVILGQDPYHGEGQAHGLCFSVQPGVRTPPSLRNIYKEMQADLGIAPAGHGHLDHWARQGVLLLNAVLTVEMGRAASHQGKGWEMLTDAIVRTVAERAAPTVFLLWGAHAQRKAGAIDETRHLVIRSAHPSPLSAHGGFLGSRPFSRANAFLEARGRGVDPGRDEAGWSPAGAVTPMEPTRLGVDGVDGTGVRRSTWNPRKRFYEFKGSSAHGGERATRKTTTVVRPPDAMHLHCCRCKRTIRGGLPPDFHFSSQVCYFEDCLHALCRQEPWRGVAPPHARCWQPHSEPAVGPRPTPPH